MGEGSPESLERGETPLFVSAGSATRRVGVGEGRVDGPVGFRPCGVSAVIPHLSFSQGAHTEVGARCLWSWPWCSVCGGRLLALRTSAW